MGNAHQTAGHASQPQKGAEQAEHETPQAHGNAQADAAWAAYVDRVGEPAAEAGSPPPEAPPEAKSDALIDLSGLITVGGLATALDIIANEPGERGRLAFEIKLEGKVPAGPVAAMGGAWAELQVMYYVNDQNFHVMEIDVAGAVRAGIDLAGFVKVGAEVGYERDFMNSWFAGSGDAGQWLYDQLIALDDFAGGELIRFGDDPAPEKHDDHGGGGKPQFELHDSAVFGGVFAEAELGDFEGDASYTAMKKKRTYHDREHHEFVSHEDHRMLDAGLEVKFGRHAFGARYNRDWSSTTGSPIYYTNGVFLEHDLTVTAGIAELFPRSFGKRVGGLPTKPVQDLVLNTFAALEKVAGPFKFAGSLNQKLFDQVVEELYHVKKAGRAGVNILCDVIFNWNTYGESTGEKRLMYFRVKVQPRVEIEAELGTPVGGVEGGVSRSKSEVVYEHIGSETVSYIQRQFLFETEDRPWKDFVATNQEQIDALVANCATPGFLYHVAAVEAAYGEARDTEAGRKALERHWRQEDQLLGQVAVDAGKLGRELDDGTSMFTWFQATRDAHMGTIYQILIKYSAPPKMMKYFSGQLPAYGVDLDQLEQFAMDTEHGSVYARLRAIADKA